MTFNAYETSARSGRKVFLYTWRRGDKVWRYTSADQSLLVNFQAYTAAAIDHDDIEQGPDLVRMNIAVRTPMALPVAQLFRATAPVDSVVLTIAEYHADDPDTQVRPVWNGRIVTVGWEPQENQATITHSATQASMGRTGLRRRCQSTCPLVLYGAGCKASRETFKLATTVAAISGVNVTAAGISAKPDGYWSGGYIEYAIESGVLERRMIRSHTSGTITLSMAPTGLIDGMGMNVYPGCDHTTGVNGCTKFSNLPNYGGFPNFPKKNPFGSEPVY